MGDWLIGGIERPSINFIARYTCQNMSDDKHLSLSLSIAVTRVQIGARALTSELLWLPRRRRTQTAASTVVCVLTY